MKKITNIPMLNTWFFMTDVVAAALTKIPN
jgi:hypothetical protein